MLVRQVRRVFARFCKQKQLHSSAVAAGPIAGVGSAQEKPKHSGVDAQYMVIPTEAPLFPRQRLHMKLRKQMYQYMRASNISYIVACILQPNAAKSKIYPHSEDAMISQLGLKKIQSAEAGTELSPPPTQSTSDPHLEEPVSSSKEDTPVEYVDHISKVFPIGSLCKISFYMNQKNKECSATIRAETRFQIDTGKYENKSSPLMYVSGQILKSVGSSDVSSNPEYNTLISLYTKMQSITTNAPPIQQFTNWTTEIMGAYLCSLSYFSRAELYHLFAITNSNERIKLLVNYYTQYIKFLEKEWTELGKKHQSKPDRQQPRQHIKAFAENLEVQLGIKKDILFASKIRKELATARFPKDVAITIEQELQDLENLMEGNPEIQRKKQYLTLLVRYPFGKVAQELYEIPRAKAILDEDHYGMKKVKERILEFIAVSKIKGEFKSKVLLLHGPPGVGKTSIAQSVARCLNRPYARISLGGEYDTSIMKGHRKTYVGAYPGKIFNSISKSKVENPVILLDEVDKIQSRAGGTSLQDVLMNVLDPIQNNKFKDQYMDIEIDLSKVLFICTANEIENIFPPLLDRMERIEVSGYTINEKKEIFKKYLLKKSMDEAGLSPQLVSQIDFTDEAIHSLIQGYCKQAGIRNLVRETNKIFKNTALKLVKNEQFDKIISQKTLREYLGLPRFTRSRLFQKIPPKGVIVGLAYNSYGGSIMYIQAASYAKQAANASTDSNKQQLQKGSLIVTGNLQDVMKESCQLAYSYAKYITSVFFNNNFLQVNDIHLNFPQIQIGKDGPSAGVAITCSLISLALNKPSIREIAMTGEITLSGKVSAIGGVKEKTMGAKREGITNLIFPEENRRDIEELETEIKEGMTFHFVKYFDEVMDLVFGEKIQLTSN